MEGVRAAGLCVTMGKPMGHRRVRDNYRGCLLGGAVGDALGAAVEFMTLASIRERFGPQGLTDYAPVYGGIGRWTDDTQLSAFTAEGLLRAHTNGTPPVEETWRAYRRWLHTQGAPWDKRMGKRRGLVEKRELHAQRAPGTTCLSALASGTMGTVEQPINNSAGCGGVMRAAPVGLAAFDDPFHAGAEIAAITHGHPSGYLPAGFLAQLVAELADGLDLAAAIDRCRERLSRESGHEETSAAIERALGLARRGKPSPEEVETLGGGWTGHEALAIAVLCALTADGFEDGVLMAVNHGGDSDSTGAITGNILGLIGGEAAIPTRWRERLELCDVIAQMADDLWSCFGGGRERSERGP